MLGTILGLCPTEHVLLEKSGLTRMKALQRAYAAHCHRVKQQLVSNDTDGAGQLLDQILRDNQNDIVNSHKDTSVFHGLVLDRDPPACPLTDVQNLNKVATYLQKFTKWLCTKTLGHNVSTFMMMLKLYKHEAPPGKALLPLEFTTRVKVLLGLMDAEAKDPAREWLRKVGEKDGSLADEKGEKKWVQDVCEFLTREVPQRVVSGGVSVSGAQASTCSIDKGVVKSMFPDLSTSTSLQAAVESMSNVAALLNEIEEETKALEEALQPHVRELPAAGVKRKHGEVATQAMELATKVLREKRNEYLGAQAALAGMDVQTYVAKIEAEEVKILEKLEHINGTLKVVNMDSSPALTSSKPALYDLYQQTYNKVVNLTRVVVFYTLCKMLMTSLVDELGQGKEGATEHKALALDKGVLEQLGNTLAYNGKDAFTQASLNFSMSTANGLCINMQTMLVELAKNLCMQSCIPDAQDSDSDPEKDSDNQDSDEDDGYMSSSSVEREHNKEPEKKNKAAVKSSSATPARAVSGVAGMIQRAGAPCVRIGLVHTRQGPGL